MAVNDYQLSRLKFEKITISLVAVLAISDNRVPDVYNTKSNSSSSQSSNLAISKISRETAIQVPAEPIQIEPVRINNCEQSTVLLSIIFKYYSIFLHYRTYHEI